MCSRHVEVVFITPAEISAFLDGELSPEERRDVAACAKEDDRAACLIAPWQWQAAMFYAAFGPIANEPIPERLRRIVGSRQRSRRSSSAPSSVGQSD